MAPYFRLIDRSSLRSESAMLVIRMVFDGIIVDASALRSALRMSFNVIVRHASSPQPDIACHNVRDILIVL